MKRTSVHIITALVALLLLAACGGGADRARLARAETLMDEHPDSALDVLDSVEGARLRGADRALYALLLTQARDKNDINLAEDTIISEAVDYYRDHGDDRRRAMAYYYRGRVGYDAKDFREAAVDFMRSKVLADRAGDPFRAGMACRNIAYVYCRLLSSEDELEYAKKAYAYMKESGKKAYELDVLNDLGRAYYNTGNLEEAMKVADQLEKEAGDEVRVQTNAKHLRALCLLDQSRYAEALPLWDVLMENPYATTLDSLRRCQTLLGLGRLEEGEKFLAEISDDDSAMRRWVKMKITRIKGNPSEAYSSLASFDSAIQTQVEEAHSYKVPSALADYFEVSAQLQQAELRATRMRNIILWVLVVLLLAMAIGTYRVIRARNKKRLHESIRLLEDMEVLNENLQQGMELAELKFRRMEDERDKIAEERRALEECLKDSDTRRVETEARLRQSEEELTRKKEELIRKEEEMKALSDRMLPLRMIFTKVIGKRMKVLRRIQPIIDELDETKKGAKRSGEVLVKKMVAAVQEIVLEKGELKELEECLNLICDNVVANFRKQVPLKETYYEIFILSLCHLQCNHMAGMLGLKSERAVESRRRDMREKIDEVVNKGMISEREAALYKKWIKEGIWNYFTDI